MHTVENTLKMTGEFRRERRPFEKFFMSLNFRDFNFKQQIKPDELRL